MLFAATTISLVFAMRGAAYTAILQSASPTLSDLFEGKLQVVDLTYAINEKTPHWPGENYEPFRLTTIATIERDGVLSKAFCMPEHLGTHLDAPNHFEKDQPSVDEIPLDHLMGAGVVISIAEQAMKDPDYELTVDDVTRWEKQHRSIPQGAIILLHTGWSRYWGDYERYKNQDEQGRLHFPAYSARAARWLIERRQVKGLGIDNLSLDRGLSEDFAVHHILNGAGRFGLENLANLKQLPPVGFYVLAAPIKIESGTGGPARVIAFVP